MAETIDLTADALAQLELHLERKGDIRVDDSNHEPYRKLARPG